MEIETVKFKQYLLGNLTPEETEKIDMQIISDAGLEEKLCWAESELAEDFLEGTLTPEETELFCKNFLISPERESQLKQIALLKNYSKNALNAQTSDEETDKPADNFFGLWKKFFTINLRPATAVLAVLIICFAFGIAWIIFSGVSNNELTQFEKKYESLNRKDLSNLSDFQNFSNVSLFSGTFRDSNSGNKLKQDALTEDVLFRFALPFGVGDETLFNVQILKEQKPVFRQNQVRVYKNQSGQEIRLIVPKSILHKGQYQISLENPSIKGSSVIYGLTVE